MPEKGTSGLMSGEGKRFGMQSGVGSAPFLDSTRILGKRHPILEREAGADFDLARRSRGTDHAEG